MKTTTRAVVCRVLLNGDGTKARLVPSKDDPAVEVPESEDAFVWFAFATDGEELMYFSSEALKRDPDNDKGLRDNAVSKFEVYLASSAGKTESIATRLQEFLTFFFSNTMFCAILNEFDSYTEAVEFAETSVGKFPSDIPTTELFGELDD